MIYQIFEEREHKILANKVAEFSSLDEAKEFVVDNYKGYDYDLVILVKE